MNNSNEIYNCLLNNKRISDLLEHRFKSNSWITSFDFKSFSLERSMNSIKISDSSSNFYPQSIESNDDNDNDNLSSETSDDEYEEISSPKSIIDQTENDRLDRLAEWEPGKSPLPMVENEEEEEGENVQQMNEEINSIDLPPEIPTNQVDDLFVTFIHCPVKNEPISYDFNLSQLDGQTDFLFNKNSKRHKNKITNILSNDDKVSKYFTSNKTNETYPIEQKIFPVNIPKTIVKKRKQLNNEFHQQKRVRSKIKRSSSMEQFGRTILDYFKVIKRSSTNENSQYSPVKSQQNNSKNRPANYFDNCITIDDDDDDNDDNDDNDTQQVQQCYLPLNNISTREKLLDHAVHSPSMRIKWLLNVELILLEHISICHKKMIEENPINSFSYHIDSSFISILILNFLKIFIIRNSNSNENEFSFHQFGLTSYIRYLLIELPTYKHSNEINCAECKQYSLIINILFDLLFDLIEYDLCEIVNRNKYRSSLIEDEYFIQLKSIKLNPFYRIKLIIYFIELIIIHRNKCINNQEFILMNENQIFHWIEDFIRHIFYQINHLKNERISMCFNIIELCLLFINERENRMKQIALFLSKLCEENFNYSHVILFDQNLLPDIRLLVINELIWNKFHIKLLSINDFEEFFHHIQMLLKPSDVNNNTIICDLKSIDTMTLELIRSLFNTYADLIINSKYSISERIIPLFRYQLEAIYPLLINLSHDSNYFEQIKRTALFFRLLKCKWNTL